MKLFNRLTCLALALSAHGVFAQNAVTAAAAKEEGAIVTSSGLVYRSLKEGSGASPKASDKVTVH